MRYRLRKTVALVGMMGSGKTAVGGALARMLDAPFLDSDTEIERAANMTIAEIFDRDGEPFFREKEAQVIARLVETQQAVLSTGGGAFMSETNRQAIARYGVSLWLQADLDLLWSRVKHKSTRPLLRGENPRQILSDLMQHRDPVYGLAGLKVQAEPGLSIEQMAERVIEALATRPDVLEVL